MTLETQNVGRAVDRLASIDVLRGFAVLLMLQTHAYDAWLREELRTTEFFRWSQLVGGFPAPLFLFLLGTSWAVAVERGLAHGSNGREWFLRGLRRAASLFAFALLFRFAMYLFAEHPQKEAVFRVDILNCLAISLGLLSSVSLVTPRFARRALSLGAAAFIAIATPFVWDGGLFSGWSDRLAGYFSGRVPNTIFPLFPWGAFAFVGLFVGQLLRTREAPAGRWLAKLGLALIACGLVFDLAPTLGPRYDYWWTSPNFMSVKAGIILLLLAAAHRFEAMGMRSRSVGHVSSLLQQLGRTSLFIYVSHVDLVYGSRAFPELWKSLDIGPASRMLAALTAAMCLLSYVWSALRSRAASWFSDVLTSVK